MDVKRHCPGCRADSSFFLRNGFYKRRSDSRIIQRFTCAACQQQFSAATFSDTYRQKKRRINTRLQQLFCSGMSMRRIALTMGISRTTVARRLTFLAERARREHEAFLDKHISQHGQFDDVQFDDLHSFEHTKCKPNNVHIMVENESRIIIAHGVSQIPANGPLAKISRKKYGYRPDESQKGRHDLFAEISKWVSDEACFHTDEHAQYPALIKKHFPDGTHRRYKGLVGCITGQGELKKTQRDPLFAVNHTLAMLRYGISRLIRRTWCTSKKNERLADHIAIYINYHNRVLLNHGAKSD